MLYLFKKRKSKAVRGLLNNIVDIRKKLLDDPNTKTIFEYTWKWPMVPKKKLLLYDFIRKNNNSRQELMRKGFIDDATDFLKKQCITDPSDFLKVDNMIRKLDERASTVRNDKTSAGRLQELNKECLKSIEDVLKEVKWNNYI